MKHTTLTLAVTSILALGLLAASAEDEKKFDASKLPAAATKTGLTFDKDIKPVFEKSCVKCHSGERPKARLDLTTLSGVLKGSKEGVVVVAGKSGESQLVYSVALVGDEDTFMPPPKNKANIGPLTKEQVALIRAWIDQGAK